MSAEVFQPGDVVIIDNDGIGTFRFAHGERAIVVKHIVEDKLFPVTIRSEDASKRERVFADELRKI